MRVCVLDYPDTTELTTVYAELLEIAFSAAIEHGSDSTAANLAPFAKPGERTQLAATLVEVYEKGKATFVVDDARHYLFTPRDLSAWVSNLLRYDLEVTGLPSPSCLGVKSLQQGNLKTRCCCGEEPKG